VIAHHKLIAGLPTDVPATLCHLIMWLDANDAPTVDDPTPSLSDLAKILHDSKMSVRRAIENGTASGVLYVENVFNQAGEKIRVSGHPKRPTESEGKLIGRLISPNWTRITELQNSSVFTLNTLKPDQGVHPEHIGRVSEEGVGKERRGEGDTPPLSLSDVVLVLAWRQLSLRWREAQQKRGISPHRQYDLVHGKQDTRTLKILIQQMEPKGFWTPYMRVVNLFSFWAEHHPTKNLTSAMAVFKSQRQEWIDKLNEWEATSLVEFRVIESKPEPDENQPQLRGQENLDALVVELTRGVYNFTRCFPPKKQARELLTKYSIGEIIGALMEYEENIAEKEVPAKTKAFFSTSGAEALINARKKRKCRKCGLPDPDLHKTGLCDDCHQDKLEEMSKS
jgi:hypothetical protein